MAIDTVIHTNTQSIDRVLRTGLPVMLVFWKRSVPQSTDLDPVLNQLAGRYAGRALIAKVDADAEPELIKRYEIRLLPSIVAIQDGKPVATLAGRVSDQAVQDWLKYLVEGGTHPSLASGPGTPTATGQPLPANGKHPTGADQGATVRDTTATPLTVTDASFDQVINGKLPVLVDFWAEWCGPCRMVAPSVIQLAQEFSGRAVVAKLNVDENQNTARRFNIMSIPALYIFKEGRVVDQIVGAQPLPILRDRLARAVGS
jgi:thioredoxin 1